MKKLTGFYVFIKNSKEKIFEIKGPADDDRIYTKSVAKMPKYFSCFTVSSQEVEKSILDLKNSGYKYDRKW